MNAITDVDGVRVGHTTVTSGDRVRTGVTAVLPHGGNLFQEKVAGAVFVGNAFGKLAGSTQVNELGTIETPIVLTNTLSVGTAMDAVVGYTLAQSGNEQVRSVNALVGETNDGGLNDIRGLHVTREHVVDAINRATPGAVAEGSVGAGNGTVCFGWKCGIGTASRRLPNGYTVGVLAQTNFGGNLTIAGVPIFRDLQPPARRATATAPGTGDDRAAGDGSCMLVVATDAPLDARDLGRLAARAVFGLGADRIFLQQRQRRLRDRVLDVARDAQPDGRDGARRCVASCRPMPCRRSSRRPSKRPRKPCTTHCFRRRR